MYLNYIFLMIYYCPGGFGNILGIGVVGEDNLRETLN